MIQDNENIYSSKEIKLEKNIKSSNHKRSGKKRKSETLNFDEKHKFQAEDADSSIVYYFTMPNRSDYPLNRDGYLYNLAEPDPLAMDQTFNYEDYITKPIPSKYYRGYSHDNIYLSYSDKAQQLKLLDDFTVCGQKGYSMIRATHGVTFGSYYFEVTILEHPEDSSLRIGWSQQYASLQAPCGYDKLSYSCRSLYGTKFHESKGKSYCEGYSKGDVLGCLISLPRKHEILNPSLKNHTLVKFKSNFYFEERYLPLNIIKKLRLLEGSEIRFYKNGVDQGTAFKDIYSGTYFPTISIFKNAKVRANFGPNFGFKPIVNNLKPMSDRIEEAKLEMILTDLFHLAEIQDSNTRTINQV